MRMPRFRPALAAGLAGTVLLVAALGLLTRAGRIAPGAALAAAVAAALAGLALLTIAHVRRLDGKVLRLSRTYLRQEEKAAAWRSRTGQRLAEIPRLSDQIAGLRGAVEEIAAALGEDRVEILTRSTKDRERLAAIERGLTEAVPARLAGIERGVGQALPARLADLTERARRIEHATDFTYTKVEALLDLRALLSPRAPMPALRDWAANPDLVHLLVTTLWRDRPKLIVECGSGASSIWLGYAAERLGTGRVVALEHDERFLAAGADLVRAHGLEHVVEVRHAPLQPWPAPDGTEFSWYATAAVEDLHDIGLLFVDGPPGGTGPLARYPAVPVLLPRCAAAATIVLDDAVREDELTISERWLAEFPELTRTQGHHLDRDAHLFHRAG